LSKDVVRAYFNGARKALKDMLSLMKSTIPGLVVGTTYGVYRYITTNEVDIIIPLILTLQLQLHFNLW